MNKRQMQRWAARLLVATAILIIGITLPGMWRPFYQTVSTSLEQYADTIAALALVAQAVIFVISARYAWGLYAETRNSSARNNTLMLIFAEHTDRTVTEQRNLFRQVRDDNFDRLEHYDSITKHKERERKKWDSHHTHLGDAASEKLWQKHWRKEKARWEQAKAAIFAVLNRYEAFAIGIATGAIDEIMYKRWWRTTLVHDWHRLRQLVLWMQSTSPNAYIEFQALAERWQEDETRERRAAAKARGGVAQS